MKNLLLILMACLVSVVSTAENKTDVSLGWKGKPRTETVIASDTGDLYDKVEHHGPAIENEWMGLRLYFNYKCAIDVYNKTKPQLELEKAAWYPTPAQQKAGWGADQYKAGDTVGLGGVRLWDGEKVVFLNPVRKRTARVRKEANISYMEMLSEGVSYKGGMVDILTRVTVFSGLREAKVETFALCDKPVQFLTGINYHPTTQTKQGSNYIVTWGIHPEDVAAFQLEIGAGLLYNADDYVSIKKEKNEFQMISKPTKYLETWITSACEKEKVLNSMEAFAAYMGTLKPGAGGSQ